MEREHEVKSGAALFLLLAVSACLMYGISAGIRANYGIILGAIVKSSGVAYEKVSLIMAIGQLAVGIVQPLFGALALRKSNSLVLGVGAAMMAAGMIGTAFCHSFAGLLLFLGLILSGGTGAMAFGIVMGAITPVIGERKAAAVSGIVSASAGLGSIVLSPAMQQLIAHIGLRGMLFTVCVPVMILIPVSLWVGTKEKSAVPAQRDEDATFIRTLKTAGKDRSCIFLFLAFFTCGFHMSIIETHLYSQYVSYGFHDTLVAFAFSVYGIAAMLGCVFTGFAGTVFPDRIVLAGVYASRVLIVSALLFLPKSTVLLYATAFLFGFTGNATVPPTSGLLTKMYGSKKLGVLFGIAFLFHQTGAFLSSWLGGICVAATGNYILIWCVSIALSLGAALLSFLVKESGKS